MRHINHRPKKGNPHPVGPIPRRRPMLPPTAAPRAGAAIARNVPTWMLRKQRSLPTAGRPGGPPISRGGAVMPARRIGIPLGQKGPGARGGIVLAPKRRGAPVPRRAPRRRQPTVPMRSLLGRRGNLGRTY